MMEGARSELRILVPKRDVMGEVDEREARRCQGKKQHLKQEESTIVASRHHCELPALNAEAVFCQLKDVVVESLYHHQGSSYSN